MKKLLLLSIIALFSCSDNLTNSKAEEIINECLENNSGKETVNLLTYNNFKYVYQYKKELMDSLEALGLIATNTSDRWNQSLMLTEKGKKHAVKLGDSVGLSNNEILAYEYKLKEVKSIHEIPSMNTAQVTVVLEKYNVTPFDMISDEKVGETFEKKVSLKKTNDGWVYCD